MSYELVCSTVISRFWFFIFYTLKVTKSIIESTNLWKSESKKKNVYNLRYRADCSEYTRCGHSSAKISWFVCYDCDVCFWFLGRMGKSRHKSYPSHTRSRHHAQFQSVRVSRGRFDVEFTHKKRTRRRPRSIHVPDQHRPDDKPGNRFSTVSYGAS